ncbi:holo-[acyl-carrier-protein] synthase [Clostridium polyendosporum]|uniref:Holo-[acyl-carrier-protein] synthase n=1 Tax=Clostridium polyendosporum TaxID=69208 RepID=A0A919RXF8_9CLOT|nr:holo-ACP synthase [Clostridium polyendosporum]GIM28280.1 holo-[acyl-carrier-protein] synthase [Clostridium polyendosporum]
MILGVGVDIIEIERIEKAVVRTKSFISRAFTEEEVKLFIEKGMRSEVIAGNFAAKEAISKALGTGVRGFEFRDIEILRDKLGKPIARFRGRARIIAELRGVKNIHISISHNRKDAIAYAVLEGDEIESSNIRDNEKY